ncbi:LOG family protein [Pseudobacteriovorax antillogorgiicola]|uniref:AMP nucleosidase n=1 Tax=Pseudobacteriovorax antillogorgiicola TaxID=1513793 RepID=A0A1Y6CAU7_9BACT|nr:LOG family protein [Pseudobacteriovorax antillogorgiicola]TCS49056.1 uncharacterized protein (TIGR00730 family) [Pseudobacteriovorax antillogorgiicola]SMF52441.1 TIGR00730 family protein [Pseudobacteriovorax antillogorgiicola]
MKTNLYLLSIASTWAFNLQALELRKEVAIKLSPKICHVINKAVPDGVIPTPQQVAKDAYCAANLMAEHAPYGAITIFGSARAKPGMESYDLTREFARQWTTGFSKYPIMTGGGPGIMEAGNRGAHEAKGKSLAIGSHFAGGQEKPNQFTTHGYMSYSFAQREADLVDYAAAIVVAPGGFGTEWEIFESLSKMQTRKKTPVPIILLGGKKHWQTLLDRVHHLDRIHTISSEDLGLLSVANTPDEAVKIIAAKLFPSRQG